MLMKIKKLPEIHSMVTLSFEEVTLSLYGNEKLSVCLTTRHTFHYWSDFLSAHHYLQRFLFHAATSCIVSRPYP